jgi:hypothetical protein
MTIIINYADGNLKDPVSVFDQTVDNSSSITLVGAGSRRWGEITQEGVLKVLENFASVVSPQSPTLGQLWYDVATNTLRLYSHAPITTDTLPASKWDKTGFWKNVSVIVSPSLPVQNPSLPDAANHPLLPGDLTYVTGAGVTGLYYYNSSNTWVQLAEQAAGGGAVQRAFGIVGGFANTLLYQSAPNTTTFLAAGTTGQALFSGGGASAPYWDTAKVANSITFTSAGNGASAGVTFDGSAAQTISYNTLGAARSDGVNATGTWPINISGTASSGTPQFLTVNASGTGAAPGTTWNGVTAVTLSYNSVGAPSTTGANATGTWGISISGNAATATLATTATTANSTNPSNNFQLNSLGVGTAASGTAGMIRATNDIIGFYSDGRLKNIEGTIDHPLAKVRALSGIYYTNNEVAKKFGYDNQDRMVGVIAQEVKAVLPEVVKRAPFDTGYVGATEFSKTGQDYLTVQYEKLVPLLIEAIKELSGQVDTLRNQVKDLQGDDK